MRGIRAFDIGDKSFVRYTVVFSDGSMLCMSDYPESPDGFSTWGNGVIGAHLGKEIKFEELPFHIQKYCFQIDKKRRGLVRGNQPKSKVMV